MFALVVELYRLSGRPAIAEDQFSYRGALSSELSTCVDKCKALSERYGKFTDLDIENESGSVSFEYLLPSSSYGRFHQTFNAFVETTPTLGKGVYPKDFYVVQDNWSTTDNQENANFTSIQSCCNLIVDLCSLFRVVDQSSNSAYHNIFLTIPAEKSGQSKSFILETKISSDIIGITPRHADIVKALISSRNERKTHLEERKLILCTSIAEIVDLCSSDEQAFVYLLKNWSMVLTKYWQNLQSYIYGFSFESARNDIAKAELEYGGKLSSALSDISGKMLAVPISFASLVLLDKSETFVEAFSIITGVLLVTIVFYGVLLNQWRNIARLNSGLDLAFFQYKKRKDTYPKQIKGLIDNALTDIESQKLFLRRTMIAFLVVAALPLLSVVTLMWMKWSGAILRFLFGWFP